MNTPEFRLQSAVFQPGELVPEDELARCLKACGRHVRVFIGARLLKPEVISVGDYSQIDEGVMIFGGERVELGCHVHLAFQSSISGGGRCVVGDFVGIGAGVRLITGTELVDGSGLTNPTVPSPYRSVRRGRVLIGAHALVLTNSIVLPDVTIGEGAVIAAGSVVHRDLKPWGIYGGNPLTQIGVRNADRIRELATKLRSEESGETATRQNGSGKIELPC